MSPSFGEPYIARRPWWATFSVRAHRNLRLLASDLLLYDRLILPAPADAQEQARFEAAGWDPQLLQAVELQAADSVYTVLWSDAMRETWERQAASMSEMPSGWEYGLTPMVMAQSDIGKKEIFATLAPETPPDELPILIAAFQSPEEAKARLKIGQGWEEGVPRAAGEHALAVEISRLVEEPASRDSEEAFLIAAELASKDEFRQARANLLSYVDQMVRNQCSYESATDRLSELEETYNTAVREFARNTWKRRAAVIIPTVAGTAAAALAGHAVDPEVAKGVGIGTTWGIKKVTGRFASGTLDPDETHPGRVFALVRAAYRDADPL